LSLLTRWRSDRRDGREEPAQTSHEDDELQPLPELAAALKYGRASFDTYVRSRFLGEERFNSDPASRAVYRKSRSALLDAYQRESGKICGSYYCEHLVGGVARTDRPRLGLVFKSRAWGKEEELLTSCDGLYWEGIDYLAGGDRSTFVERLYAVASDVLASLDSRRGPGGAEAADATGTDGNGGPRSEALAALGRKLDDVRAFYAKAVRKRARLRYLAGVAAGIGATSAFAGILLLILWAAGGVPADERGEIIASWVAGAIGAVVSVMQRVSSDSLELNHEAGRLELWLLGAMRPVVGAVVALALYSLFAGGILDFARPEGASADIYYYAGVGFLSGFSERFAQDMLVRTGSSLSGSSTTR
jgi:hypothetical protein